MYGGLGVHGDKRGKVEVSMEMPRVGIRMREKKRERNDGDV